MALLPCQLLAYALDGGRGWPERLGLATPVGNKFLAHGVSPMQTWQPFWS